MGMYSYSNYIKLNVMISTQIIRRECLPLHYCTAPTSLRKKLTTTRSPT